MNYSYKVQRFFNYFRFANGYFKMLRSIYLTQEEKTEIIDFTNAVIKKSELKFKGKN